MRTGELYEIIELHPSPVERPRGTALTPLTTIDRAQRPSKPRTKLGGPAIGRRDIGRSRNVRLGERKRGPRNVLGAHVLLRRRGGQTFSQRSWADRLPTRHVAVRIGEERLTLGEERDSILSVTARVTCTFDTKRSENGSIVLGADHTAASIRLLAEGRQRIDGGQRRRTDGGLRRIHHAARIVERRRGNDGRSLHAAAAAGAGRAAWATTGTGGSPV